MFSGDVEQVAVPGAEGEFGVLANHVLLVAALRPGILTYARFAREAQKIVVLRGFAEVSAQGLTVLADVATAIEELDRPKLAATISEMQEKLPEKEGVELDREIARLDHFKAIQSELETTAMH